MGSDPKPALSFAGRSVQKMTYTIIIYKFLIAFAILLLPLVLVVLAFATPLIWYLILCLTLACVPSPIISCMLVFWPVTLVWVYSLFCESIHEEAMLIAQVGKEHALWATLDGRLERGRIRHPSTHMARHIVLAGWEQVPLFFSKYAPFFEAFGIDDFVRDGKPSIQRLGSIIWSKFILALDSSVVRWSGYSVFVCASALWVNKVLKSAITSVVAIIDIVITLLCIVYFMPNDLFGTIVEGSVRLAVSLTRVDKDGRYIFLDWLGWKLLMLVVEVTGLLEGLNESFRRRHSATIAGGSKRLVAHFRVFTIQAAAFVSDLGLPNYVRRRMKSGYTLKDLMDSNELMKDIGWPINVELTDPHEEAIALGFKEWILSGTDFATGVRNMKVHVDHSLDSLRLQALEYRRSETYASEENELRATARYFKSPKYNFPDLLAEDVWFVLGDIFRHSRLTPFNYIIQMWEKRYALGAFMRKRDSKSKKKRSEFIGDLGGYGPFKRLWARTFYYASILVPTAAVSVKGEALPEKKWAYDKVRSVIGSPISQYILSTIWNYGPNHRFAWESTPIKVGMPLNGYWMAQIFARHARCQIHVEGDMSDFDSTVSGSVLKLIAAMRKKGYELHKDRDRIADLIDINYEQVEHQLLNTTSTGTVYMKGTGLTTGHSSTSMDNSMALVILYLMAWKELTGLSSREFVHFNELSNFGDDHILSFVQTRPLAWTPRNIRSVMAKWGVTNNLITKPLVDIEFLSKFGRVASIKDISHLESNGVKDVRFVVFHNKQKLVGKLVASVKSLDPSYRLKRLMSYLDLTAHHEDTYNGIVKALSSSKQMQSIMRNNKMTIPSYAQVLKNWYKPSRGQVVDTTFDDDPVEGLASSNDLVQYGATNLLDSFFGTLSMLPDLLNPVMFNYGYMRAVQLFLRPRLAWIVDFIAVQNSCVSAAVLQRVLTRTQYRWLEVNDFVIGASGANFSSNLVKHWLVSFYMTKRKTRKANAWLNFIFAKLANFQYLLNGRLVFENRDNNFDADILLVCAAASLIRIPDVLFFLQPIVLPDLQLYWDMIVHYFLVTIWTTVPPNFKEVGPALEATAKMKKPLVIQAPTGVGKSTALIAYLFSSYGRFFKKIVVVEPRSVLVTGLVHYMKDSYGLPVSGSTTGLDIDKTQRVFYMTPQALMNHLDLWNAKTLFVLDECHLQEEFYIFIKRLMSSTKIVSVWLSATPSESNKHDAGLFMELPIPQIFSKEILRENVTLEGDGDFGKALPAHITRRVLDEIAILGPSHKALFCVPTIKIAEDVSRLSNKRVAVVTSHHRLVDFSEDKIFVATPVVDVGVTIDGLNFLWTSNVGWDVEQAQFSRSTKTTMTQRFGRVGRTCNGLIKLVNYTNPFPQMAELTTLSPNNWRNLVLGGAPVELALSMDRIGVMSAIGIDASHVPEEEYKGLARSMHLFLANMRPVFLGQNAAREANDDSMGEPFMVAHTGSGHLSSSLPQDPAYTSHATISAMAYMVKNILKLELEDSEIEAFKSLQTIFGPIIRVGNLVSALIADPEDGMSDSLNPKGTMEGFSPSNLTELRKISMLLKQFSKF